MRHLKNMGARKGFCGFLEVGFLKNGNLAKKSGEAFRNLRIGEKKKISGKPVEEKNENKEVRKEL